MLTPQNRDMMDGAVWNAMRNLLDAGRRIDAGSILAWVEKFFPHWTLDASVLWASVKLAARDIGLVRLSRGRQDMQWVLP